MNAGELQEILKPVPKDAAIRWNLYEPSQPVEISVKYLYKGIADFIPKFREEDETLAEIELTTDFSVFECYAILAKLRKIVYITSLPIPEPEL